MKIDIVSGPTPEVNQPNVSDWSEIWQRKHRSQHGGTAKCRPEGYRPLTFFSGFFDLHRV